MKPFRSISPLASWVLRIALLMVVISLVHPIVSRFDVGKVQHIVYAILAIFSLLLFVGGFFKTNTMTIVSGIAIMLLCGWLAYSLSSFSILNTGFTTLLLTGSIGFYFFVNGNK